MNLTDRINRVLNNPHVTELVKGTIRLALAEEFKAHAMSMVVRIEEIEKKIKKVSACIN